MATSSKSKENWPAGAGCQIVDGPDDAPRGGVALRIILTTQDHDARMVTLCLGDQLVEPEKIVVVARKENMAMADRLSKMHGIGTAHTADL